MSVTQKVGLRRSSVTGNIPNASQINLGELAFNTVDGKIYFKDESDNIYDLTDNFTQQEINTLLSNLTTDDITEANNLYFTEQRARDSISVGGDLSYLGGVISFNETYSNASQIKTAYESNTDTNAFTDSDVTKLDSLGNAGERDFYLSTSDPDELLGNDGDIWFQYSNNPPNL